VTPVNAHIVKKVAKYVLRVEVCTAIGAALGFGTELIITSPHPHDFTAGMTGALAGAALARVSTTAYSIYVLRKQHSTRGVVFNVCLFLLSLLIADSLMGAAISLVY